MFLRLCEAAILLCRPGAQLPHPIVVRFSREPAMSKPIKINEFMDTLDGALKFSEIASARVNKEEKA